MAMPARQDALQDHAEPAPLIGRDELNLAEFPIALIADRVPVGQKTLYFEDRHGRLTVAGSDAYGLPTATDTDVIVALIYLTKLRNGFSDVKVNFSRYEVIKLLNWPADGAYYKRLDLSLNRWAGVLLVYDKCWWNNRTRRYASAKMHILDSVVLAEPGERARDRRSHPPLSTFTWNRTFIESCQADNLRRLDLDTYFSLKSAVSKRLYRFLGKRFWSQGEWTFDLDEIAFDRVGLSRNYAGNAGKIKEKLQPAIDELEAIGFLKPLGRHERYSRVDRGQWTIRLTRQSPGSTAPPPAADTPAEDEALPTPPATDAGPSLAIELVARGVSAKVAAELVRRHPAEAIRAKIGVFDWMAGKQDKRLARSPAGYLVKSITDDYAPPRGYVSREERQAREEAHQARERQEAEQRRRQREEEARERALQGKVDAYIERLTSTERQALEAEALAGADPKARQACEEAVPARLRAILRLGLVREHVARELFREATPEAGTS